MTVRAKPWSYQSNSNTSSCDGSNSSVSGWSGGNTNNFLQQLVDECGDLCSSESCSTTSGDVNEDENLNIQDIIIMVNHILSVTLLEGCALGAADMNMDEIINIQDLISLVNDILGSARSAQLDGKAQVEYLTSGNDLIVQIASSIDVAGMQISVLIDSQIEIELKDNSHITQDSHFHNGLNQYLAYSLFNQPFDSRTTEILLKGAGLIDLDDIQITISDINGDALYLSHSQSGQKYQMGPYKFEMNELYPNPFNPRTQISFSLPEDDYVKLSAYNIRGNEVDVIFEGAQSVGHHSYSWNASNIPSGVYYIRLQAGELVTSQKALLIK
ncbi:T9SS C-terminal target domain-containing protein [Candidatus Marinimicrobia bacterium PRS2]|nr:T9SS C-terminal target domain-containing protein [Candidatus Marinimicrobia bacterium PRS2]